MEQTSPGKQLVDKWVIIVCGGFLWSMSNVIVFMVLMPSRLMLSMLPAILTITLYNIVIFAIIWTIIATKATFMDLDQDVNHSITD